MINETEQTAEVAERPAKKIKVNFKMAKAILAVHEAKKIGHHVNYKALAVAWDVNWQSLKTRYSSWVHGRVDLGVVDQTPEDRAIDQRVQHAKTLDLVNRHLALLLVHYEGAIFEAECQKKRTGKKGSEKVTPTKSLQDSPLTFLSREVNRLMNLRSSAEQGYDSYLSEMRQREIKRTEPKKLEGHPATIEVATHVITAEEERAAVEALSRE